MKFKLTLALLAALAMAGGLVWSGHIPTLGFQERIAERRKPQTVTPLPPAVSVVRAVVANFVETLLVTGSLVARDEILVGPEIDGLRVLEVLADEGDAVRRGQVLARLVNETIDAQLAQNTAALARADAAIAQAQSNITQADARLVEARNAINRAKTLRDSGYLSESMFDQRDSAAKMAAALLIAARDGLRLAEADKAQIEAQRRDLQWRRGKTEVTAPADGIISRRNAKIGATAAGTGEPMFRIIANGEVELDAEVIETRIAGVREGQAARVQVAGAGFHDATVRLVSPEVDRPSRMARVRLFIGAKRELKPGAFARAIIDTAKSQGVAVPSSALLFSELSTIVQVVANNQVVTRRVETGLTSAGLIEIRRGVAPGELVVARSGTFLRDGDAVRPVPLNGGRLNAAEAVGVGQ